MKKILIVTDSLNGGGAERVLYNILTNIDLKKYEIKLFLFHNEGVYLKKIKELGIEIDYLFNERKDLFKNIIYKKIKSLIMRIIKYFYCKFNKNKEKFDIEIGFLEGYSTFLIANRKNKSKKISWVHSDLEKYKSINRILEKKSYSKIEQIICVSEDSKKALERLYPENKKKLKVIYNPINKEEILIKSKEKKEINYSNLKINVITLGRLTYVKGYDILLKAHSELLKEGLEYDLYILGEGEERKKIEKFISKNKINKNTFLLGFKENPYPYLKDADFFVSTSRYEGYPLVLCEAICLKKPIIATKCTGSIEILENGKYGVLNEIEDVKTLKESMKEFILDKTLRDKYSKLSIEASIKFDMRARINDIVTIFEEK